MTNDGTSEPTESPAPERPVIDDLEPLDRSGQDDLDPRPPPVTTTVEPSFGIPWRLGIFMLFAVAIVVFAVQNTQTVAVEFLGWTWSLPLVIVILIAVVITIILDESLGAILRRRRLRRRREKEELARLRTLK